MFLVVIASLAAAGAPEIWVEPSTTFVGPDLAAEPEASDSARLCAARGERESFQLCVRCAGAAIRGLRVEPSPRSPEWMQPEIRRVACLTIDRPSPRAFTARTLWPDPLPRFAPCDLAAGETGVLWITYTVPRDANPGRHKTSLLIQWEGGSAREIPVAIRVFDFVLPEIPTLRTVCRLDAQALRTRYAIQDLSVEAWRPFYAAIAQARLGFAPWHTAEMVRFSAEGVADPGVLQEHMEALFQMDALSAIAISHADSGLSLFPPPEPGASFDPLGLYLRNMASWLDSRGWLANAYVEPLCTPERARWEQARAAAALVHQEEPGLRRLMVARPHPAIDGCAEIYGTPLEYAHPDVVLALRQGAALGVAPNPRARTVSASSSWPGPASKQGTSFDACPPEDAYDGCLFTWWRPLAAPTLSAPQRLDITLEKPCLADTIRVAWHGCSEPGEVRVFTAPEGGVLSSAGVAWKHHPTASALDYSYSEGHFKFEKRIATIRLEFRGGQVGEYLGVIEVGFSGADSLSEASESNALPASPPNAAPIDVWLRLTPGTFPSLAADAHPIEARLIAWLCASRDMSGVIGAELNAWPRAWRTPGGASDPVWSGADAGEAFLFYPGAEGLIPSLRSERLRDAIEDFEYIRGVQDALGAGRIKAKDAEEWLPALWCIATPDSATLGSVAEHIGKVRVKMGHALAHLAREE